MIARITSTPDGVIVHAATFAEVVHALTDVERYSRIDGEKINGEWRVHFRRQGVELAEGRPTVGWKGDGHDVEDHR